VQRLEMPEVRNSGVFFVEKPTMKNSDYMEWAKTKSGARFNLATSGVREFPFRDLKVRLDDLELRRPPGYMYEPLQNALAEKSGVPAECVVPALGTSFANHLAMRHC
jgi:hypothetical protein